METWRAELYHHGILGMHWFERNGPPYPLDRPDAQGHSGSEIRAGYKKSIDGTAENAITKYGGLKVKSKDNLTPEEKAEQEARRNRIKKAVIATAAVAGIGAAVYLAHKHNVVGRVKDMIQKSGKDISKTSPEDLKDMIAKAHNMSREDIGVVYKAGDELHRMHGFKDFDLEKVGKTTFAAKDDLDQLVYKTLLADTNGSERYDVTLKAVNDIIAPTREKTYSIIEDMVKNDPQIRQDIIDDTAKMLLRDNKNLDLEMAKGIAEKQIEFIEKKPGGLASKAITAVAAEGKTAEKLEAEFTKQGFNAIQDLHDIDDGIAKSSLILLNAKTNFVKTGEQAITQLDREKALDQLMKEVKGNQELFAIEQILKQKGLMK